MMECHGNLLKHNTRSSAQELETSTISRAKKPNTVTRSLEMPNICPSFQKKFNWTDSIPRSKSEIIFLRDIFWLKSVDLCVSNNLLLIEKERDAVPHSLHEFPLSIHREHVDNEFLSCESFSDKNCNEYCINEVILSKSLSINSTPKTHNDANSNNSQTVIPETPEASKNEFEDNGCNTLLFDNTVLGIPKSNVHAHKQCTDFNKIITIECAIQNAHTEVETMRKGDQNSFQSIHMKENKERQPVKRRKLKSITQDKSVVRLTIPPKSLKDIFTRYNTADIVLQSIQNILAILCERNENSSIFDLKKYDAVNAILNCLKVGGEHTQINKFTEQVIEALQSSFEHIIYGNDLYNVRSWVYRLLSILELCCSQRICIEIMEFLITGLDVIGRSDDEDSSFFVLNNSSQSIYYQLHVLIFGLDVIVRKMQKVLSLTNKNTKKERRRRRRVPLIELHYSDGVDNNEKQLYEESHLEDSTTMKRWASILQKFASIMTERSPELAVRSLKLRDTLLSL